MSNQILVGKRVLVTQADQFMGPALCEVFAKHGATVIASTDPISVQRFCELFCWAGISGVWWLGRALT
jgi:NAD(P)-dependent dehydrogenase (short-subunit alcohol dehydrogenase family)